MAIEIGSGGPWLGIGMSLRGGVRLQRIRFDIFKKKGLLLGNWGWDWEVTEQ